MTNEYNLTGAKISFLPPDGRILDNTTEIKSLESSEESVLDDLPDEAEVIVYVLSEEHATQIRGNYQNLKLKILIAEPKNNMTMASVKPSREQ